MSEVKWIGGKRKEGGGTLRSMEAYSDQITTRPTKQKILQQKLESYFALVEYRETPSSRVAGVTGMPLARPLPMWPTSMPILVITPLART